jgi:pimeloyl-ACP methyl ester carboxylesterase
MKTLTRCLLVVSLIALGSCAPSEEQPAEEPVPQGLENGSFTANLNDFDIHYEVHGQGPVTMVLTNSWGLSLEGLRAVFEPLERKLTMVYFDPRGMGESSEIKEESDMGMEAVRADFQALREHLGLASVNAIGWSNGAMNLIYLAAENPDTIDNAIFLHGAASYTAEDYAAMAQKYPEMIETWQEFTREMQDPVLTNEERTAKQRALWIGEWFPLSFADQEAAPAALDRIFGEAEFSWAHADYSQRAHPEFDALDQLPLITARCLVISGAHDMMPVSKGEELAAGISNAEFVLFEASGHYAPVEEPVAFEDLVFGFLGVD